MDIPIITVTGELLDGKIIGGSCSFPALGVTGTLTSEGPPASFSITGSCQFPSLVVTGTLDKGGKMAINIGGTVAFPSLAVTGAMTNEAPLTGSLSAALPYVTLLVAEGGGESIKTIGSITGTCTASQDIMGSLEKTLAPVVVKEISGGWEAVLQLLPVTISSAASLSAVGMLTKEIAAVTIQSSAYSNENGTFTRPVPALAIISTASSDILGSTAKALPLIKLTSEAINGYIGDLSKSIPASKQVSTAYWVGTATVSEKLPTVRISARGENSNIIAILMNVKNFALTSYTSYNYNSLGVFNGVTVGAKADGIYELSGSDDNGTSIAWKFKTGKLDMDDGKVKKARHVWVSYNPSGDLILTVDDGETQYEYAVNSVKQIDNAYRVKLGKGIRNRFLQFELKNIGGETIKLERMRIFSEPIEKKR